MNRKLRLHSKDSTNKFGGPYLCLKVLYCFRFSKCVFIFSLKIFSGRNNFFFLQTKVVLAHVNYFQLNFYD